MSVLYIIEGDLGKEKSSFASIVKIFCPKHVARQFIFLGPSHWSHINY